MDKCVVLILAVAVVSVDSKNDSYDEGDSGIEAFEIAYFDLNTLLSYYEELINSATVDCIENVLLPPINWCNKYYGNDALVDADYVVTENGVLRELSSIEALKQSYHNIYRNCDQFNNAYTQEYFEYIYTMYKPLLCKQYIKSPVQFCMGANPFEIPASRNEDADDRHENRHATDRAYRIVLDNDGLEIDLNKP